MSVLTSNIDRNECRGTVASANQWPDHRYRETRNRRSHKIRDTTGSSLGSTSAIRKSALLASISLLLVRKSDFLVSKSDFPVSISLLLVSKSDFLVADELASFSDDLSTLRRTQPCQARGSAPRVTPKATTFLKIFTIDVFFDPSRLSYG